MPERTQGSAQPAPPRRSLLVVGSRPRQDARAEPRQPPFPRSAQLLGEPRQPMPREEQQRRYDLMFAQAMADPRVREKLVSPTSPRASPEEMERALRRAGFSDRGRGQWSQTVATPIEALHIGGMSLQLRRIEGRNDVGDMRRHATWGAMAGQRYGATRATEVLNSHERTAPNSLPERTMDVINNHNGAVMGEALPPMPPHEIVSRLNRAGMLQREPSWALPPLPPMPFGL